MDCASALLVVSPPDLVDEGGWPAILFQRNEAGFPAGFLKNEINHETF
jgi:hypothetical protein